MLIRKTKGLPKSAFLAYLLLVIFTLTTPLLAVQALGADPATITETPLANIQPSAATLASTPSSTQAQTSTPKSAPPASVPSTVISLIKQPSATPATAAPSAPQDNYQINEQFQDSVLSPDLWQVMTLPKGYRNQEEQDYLPSQVKVANGYLQINAVRDSTGAWHSGEVHSRWNYKYGEFEVRMALSATGAGIWPAAWLMGTTDSWPANGEIDIMENLNGSSTVYGTIHGEGSNNTWQLQTSMAGIDVTKFHTYKIVKNPGVVEWWVDGIKRSEWLQAETPSGGIWPFETHSNFALLNLAIGGNWPGPSNTTTPDNITLYVDYFTVKNGS